MSRSVRVDPIAAEILGIKRKSYFMATVVTTDPDYTYISSPDVLGGDYWVWNGYLSDPYGKRHVETPQDII